MERVLEKKMAELQLMWVINPYTFNSLKWTCLFGVSSIETLGYEHEFWTERKEIVPQDLIGFKDFKLREFYEKPISQILIVCQSGYHTILKLPDESRPLMDYLSSAAVTNLTYVSGA